MGILLKDVTNGAICIVENIGCLDSYREKDLWDLSSEDLKHIHAMDILAGPLNFWNGKNCKFCQEDSFPKFESMHTGRSEEDSERRFSRKGYRKGKNRSLRTHRDVTCRNKANCRKGVVKLSKRKPSWVDASESREKKYEIPTQTYLERMQEEEERNCMDGLLEY